MNSIKFRMKALIDLGIPSVIQIDERTAMMKINSEWDVKVTILEKSIIYEPRHNGKTYDLKKDLGVPDDVKGVIEALEEKFTAALLSLLDGEIEYSEDGEKPVNEAIENLKEGGFEIESMEEPDLEAEEKARLEREENEKILAALEAGEIQKPETKPAVKAQRPARQERAVQRMHARIPEDVRSKQIANLTKDDIKNYLCPTATDQEAYMFLQLCQARKLNPFLNEAYLIKYGNKATMTVGKEAYMRRAEAHPQFDGFEAGIIIQHPDKTLERREGTFILKGETLVGGWAKIYRKDRKQPFISEVTLDEYNTKQSLWVSKPATMIRKVAIVQGKREAFPSEFAGMYDPAEMGVSDEDIIEATYQEVEA